MSVVTTEGDGLHEGILGAVNFTESKAFDAALKRAVKMGMTEDEAKDLLTGKVQKSEGFAHIFKANPYHDELGRFSTADRSSFVSTGPKFSKTLAKLRSKMKVSEGTIARAKFWDYTEGDNQYGMYGKADDLIKGTQEQWDSLTSEEKISILGYTGKSGEKYDAWYYGDINPMVGNAATKGKKLSKEQLKIVDVLDSALNKGSLPEDMYLCKAIDISHSGLKGFDKDSDLMHLMNLIGHTIEDGAYSSTSASMDVAQGFQRTERIMLRLEAPKGTKGMWVGGSDERTAFKTEMEFVLPRGTSYLVTGVFQHTDRWGKSYPVVTAQVRTP